MIDPKDLAPPTHEQLHRLRRALLGEGAEPCGAPLKRLLDVVAAVRGEAAASLLAGEECPAEFDASVQAANTTLVALFEALTGSGASDDFADPWARLEVAGYAKGAVEQARNPRYLAYCRAHGCEDPEAMIAFDKARFPGGHMAGFIAWTQERWAEWRKLRLIPADAPISREGQDDFSCWLDEKHPSKSRRAA